uniref:Major facilitator superfamily (MFS) profile domain-containing protein n=1 Tax=Anopheles merus TaxID=30066 RepID=A0A182VMP5_ANOME
MGNGTKTTQQRQPEEDRADLASTAEEEEREQLTAPSNLHYIQPSFISLISEKQWKPDGERQQDVPVYGRTTMATTILTQEAHTNGARMQLIMSILANLTVLSSGMGLGYSAITLHALTSEDNPMRMNSSQASWFASISSFACPLGGLVSGYLLDRIGRKKTLMLINVLSIVSWALIAVCSTTNFDLMYTQILVARVIIGIVIGLVSAPASIYSAEIATPKMRGRLTVLTSLSIAVGILLIYSMGYAVPDDFRLVAGLAAGICVLSLALLLFMPESPAWLMSKDREEEAERSLKKIRGYGAYSQRIPEVEKELMRMRDNVLAQRRAGQESFLRLLKQPQVYKPLGIIIGFFGFQQFSGIFVIVVYAAKVSSEASVSMDPFLCTVLIGITRVVATMLVAYILDTLGRKPPSIFSGVGMLVCMFGLALCSYFPPIESLHWIPTVLILTYIFTSTLGFLTMPFSMLAELFPQAVRGPASGVTVFFTYLMSFCTIKLYPSMVELLGSANVFLIYGAVSLLGVLYVIYVVPETKGKSLQEIEDYFRGMSHGSTPSQEVEEDEVSNLSSESV